MPYLRNGNARDFLENNPDYDRQKIVRWFPRSTDADADRNSKIYHISLGLLYLHSQNIVHGDLKAVSLCLVHEVTTLIPHISASSMF